MPAQYFAIMYRAFIPLLIIFTLVIHVNSSINDAGSQDETSIPRGSLKKWVVVLNSKRVNGQRRRLSSGVLGRFMTEIAAFTPVGGAEFEAEAEIAFDGESASTPSSTLQTRQIEATLSQPLLSLFEQGPAVLINANSAGVDFLKQHADVLTVTEDIDVTAAVLPPNRYTSAVSGPLSGMRRRLDDSGMQLQPPWSLDRVDQRTLPLDTIYQYNTNNIGNDENGTGVDIYSIDSGVRITHREFAGGKIDLVDSINVSPDQASNVLTDCAGHGTHVSGTAIGASVGIARDATLIVVRVYGANCLASGPLSSILAGFSAAIGIIAKRGGRPSVCSLSFATPARLDLLDSGTAELSQHCIVVAAAGNNGGDSCITSPQAAGIIRVAASTRLDVLAPFSDAASCVDLIAPGDAILSASFRDDISYALMSGTSMSTPLVAGITASYLSVFPAATAEQVKAALRSWASTGVLDITSRPTTPNLLIYKPSCGWSEQVITCPDKPIVTPSSTPSVGALPPNTLSLDVQSPSPTETPLSNNNNAEPSAIAILWVSASAAEGIHTGVTLLNLLLIFFTASTFLLAIL